jgi:threonine/homoserine/homoserine lactone efflux protein
MKPFLTGVLAGYGIAIPVGAIALLIVETGMRRGFRHGFAAGAGAATADLVYAGVAVVSGATVAGMVGAIGAPFRYLAGGILAGIALLGLWRLRGGGVEPETDVRARGVWGIYAGFLGLTLVNPTTVIYFAAVVMGLGLASGMSAPEGLAFVAGAGLASLSWQTLLAWSGATAGARMGARARRSLSIVGYMVILGLAAAILLG